VPGALLLASPIASLRACLPHPATIT
jgi:hypothetical protein